MIHVSVCLLCIVNLFNLNICSLAGVYTDFNPVYYIFYMYAFIMAMQKIQALPFVQC